MNFSDYQAQARYFAVYPDKGHNITYPTLGLTGEAGEVANQVKKIQRDDKGLITWSRETALVDEMGDVLWYLANICSELDIDLSQVAKQNIDKLTERKEQDSIHGDKRIS